MEKIDALGVDQNDLPVRQEADELVRFVRSFDRNNSRADGELVVVDYAGNFTRIRIFDGVRIRIRVLAGTSCRIR